MKIHNKRGSKNRLFEMFRNVNKLPINENFGNEEMINTNHPLFNGLINNINNNEFIEEFNEWDGMNVTFNFDATGSNFTPHTPATQDQPQEGGYNEDVQFNLISVVISDEMGAEYVLSNDAMSQLPDVHQRLSQDFSDKLIQSTNESFDSPKEKDEKYLDNSVGQDEFQVSKYDGGVRYPVEEPLKVDDESLEGLVGDDLPFKEAEEHPLADVMDMKVDDEENPSGCLPHSAQSRIITRDELMDCQQMGVKDSDFEEKKPEDSLLYPSEHWVDHYVPMKVGDESLEGGLADGAEPMEFDENQILKGVEIEMEHTNDPKIALEITMDHLKEIPDYYDHLEKMESNEEKPIEMDENIGTPSNLDFNYDQKGNWIPKGLEDKKIALRPVEEPMGSRNKKVLIVSIDDNGGVKDVYDTKDSWDEAVVAMTDMLT